MHGSEVNPRQQRPTEGGALNHILPLRSHTVSIQYILRCTDLNRAKSDHTVHLLSVVSFIHY